MPESAIAITNLSFSHGKHVVLDNLSCTIPTGRCVALLGPNGSGKSTLLDCIAGLAHPSQGNISLHGSPLSQLPPLDRAAQFALVPQSSEGRIPFTVRQTILLGRLARRGRFSQASAEDHAAVQTLLKEYDLTALADRPLDCCSGGERQLALLVRAVAQDPAILILDEATSALDIRRGLSVLQHLKEWCRTDRTVLAVLHDLHLAAGWADQVILLHQGKVLEQGETRTVLSSNNISTVFGVQADIRENRGKMRLDLDLMGTP
jgi:iron complex transport system ATP-binding protein